MVSMRKSFLKSPHCLLGILFAFLLFTPNADALTKKKFDFIVGVTGDFKAAMTAAAASGATTSNRFHIFFPDGEYNIGSLTGDANQRTLFPTSNVSFIGQSADKTVVYNKSIQEGISITATLYFSKADNLYLQDLTVENKAVTAGSATRHVAIQEQGNKIIYKNVKLKATQDTYYTKGTRTYWEDGMIYGSTDFVCGGGDVFFNRVTLYALKVSALIAPQSNTSWGYVFKDGVIDGDVSGFTLGRSWGDARAVFINTTMKKLPTAAGWGDPMNSVPKVFAEYKSKNADGSLINLSQRRTTYSKNGVTVTLNPVLSDAEAAKYTISGVLAGTDNWQPQTYTQQVAAPVVSLSGKTLTWADDAKALCWVIFKNGKYLANVTATTYDASAVAAGETLTVRAANEMGGLGAPSNAVVMGAVVGKQYALTVNVQGSGSVSPSSGNYSENQNLSLQATPSEGWTFDQWSGDLSGKTNPSSLKMDAAKSVTASFMPLDKFVYQAEWGVLNEVVFENRNTGFTGTGYANFNAVAGAFVKIPVYADHAGTFKMTVAYSNGSGASRSLNLSVNENAQSNSMEFAPTTDWATWQTKEISIDLVQGLNDIQFGTVGGQDGPNLDKITLSPISTRTSQTRSEMFSLRYFSQTKTLTIDGKDLNDLEIRVYTVDGTHLLAPHSTTSRSIKIPLSHLQPGRYIIKVSGRKSLWTQSLDIP